VPPDTSDTCSRDQRGSVVPRGEAAEHDPRPGFQDHHP
jgi:hypothetical protein